MPESEIIPDGSIPDAKAAAAAPEAAPAENAWVAFERGRVSRRQALKKLGMTSAMAAFALFSVDDLARMVGKAMEQRARDNKVAEQVAKEFQQAGIALAGSPCYGTCCPDYDCSGCGGSAATGDCCYGSSDPNACCGKSYGPASGQAYISCQQCCAHATGVGAGDYYQACVDSACGTIS